MEADIAFIATPRVGPEYRTVEERLRSWDEFLVQPPEEVLREQAGRCMDCGIPFCHALGCPLHGLIPEWNQAVAEGDWYEAFLCLEQKNNLPEVTGRVCPAMCESACTLAIGFSPVTIAQLELAIVEHAFDAGWVVPRPPSALSGRSVAVVGSGPAGLAAAQQLRRAGHEVTLFEQAPRLGGLLRYGIPTFKLEKSVLDRRLRQFEAEGVRFEPGVCIGEDVSAEDLRRSFDAVLLALGAGEPRDLPVPGRELDGVHFALEFLSLANRLVAGEVSEEELISARDKHVLVIGGGDTGADCVGTANRLGALGVRQVEILPRPPDWEESWNPSWPRRPNVMRTTSSHEEGCERDWAIQTRRLFGEAGRVSGAELVRVDWESPPEGGPARPVERPGTEHVVAADLVLLALGFVHVRHTPLLDRLGVELDERGNIRCAGYATSAAGVFAAGDATDGPSLVVTAIHHGRKAAAAVDAYLRG